MAWLRERPEVNDTAKLWLYARRGEGKSTSYEYEPELSVTSRIRCTRNGRSQWIWITRDDRDSDGKKATVSFLGRDKALLESILEEGREIQRQKREKFLTVVQVYDFGKEHGLNWLHPQDKDRKQPGRSISSVVLPRHNAQSSMDQAEALLEDAREFLASEAWYTERGIPYRRGYLLYGVPGGGKSSLIMAVASELRLPIYVMSFSSERMNDEVLSSLLQYGMHDPPTILLLEDVDMLHSAVLNRHKPTEESDSDQESEKRNKRRGRLTLSCLLNALDGPTATTGRLLFMTTNNRDALDPALLRSGRIDYELEFKPAASEQICRLFLRFYSDFSRANHMDPAKQGNGELKLKAERFVQRLEESGRKLTTADIQRHLMKRKKSPERAVQEVQELIDAFADEPTAPRPEKDKNTAQAA
ncbi:unnamed protein product [Durusdinium trenchii]|uniref:AAA+ ATPase domain-containing protein n=1 Tax=Durusdinium trenchii TaxID=1381693 RepID=A0ABP0KM96_9DINO